MSADARIGRALLDLRDALNAADEALEADPHAKKVPAWYSKVRRAADELGDELVEVYGDPEEWR